MRDRALKVPVNGLYQNLSNFEGVFLETMLLQFVDSIEKNVLNKSSGNFNWLIYKDYSKCPRISFLKFWFLHFLQLIMSRENALRGALYLEPKKMVVFLNFFLSKKMMRQLCGHLHIFRYISELQFLIFYVWNIFEMVAVAAIFRKFSEKSIFVVIILQPKPII